MIDAITNDTETALEEIYMSALSETLRKHRPALNRLKSIMDGETRPPRWCITENQKARWREREAMKILKASGLQEALTKAAQKAGEMSEKEIERMRDEVYSVAYEDTYNRLRR